MKAGKGYGVYGVHGKVHDVGKTDGTNWVFGTRAEAKYVKGWAEKVLRGHKLRKKVRLSIRGY